MRRAVGRYPPQAFDVPDGLQAVQLCNVSYLRPADDCPVYTEYFKDGDDVPTEICPIHRATFRQRVGAVTQNVFASLGKKLKRLFGR